MPKICDTVGAYDPKSFKSINYDNKFVLLSGKPHLSYTNKIRTKRGGSEKMRDVWGAVLYNLYLLK